MPELLRHYTRQLHYLLRTLDETRVDAATVKAQEPLIYNLDFSLLAPVPFPKPGPRSLTSHRARCFGHGAC